MTLRLDLKSPKLQGTALVLLGLWTVVLTWALYSRYSALRRNAESPNSALAVFLSISGALLGGAIWWVATSEQKDNEVLGVD